MNFKNKKTYYSPWAFTVVDNFLNKEEISEIKKEILKFRYFDDKVMVNRKRVNKGTKNFQDLTEKSYAVKNLYRKLNTPSFYRTITNFFDTKKLEWVPYENYSKYSKNFYGEQKFSFKEKY